MEWKSLYKMEMTQQTGDVVFGTSYVLRIGAEYVLRSEAEEAIRNLSGWVLCLDESNWKEHQKCYPDNNVTTHCKHYERRIASDIFEKAANLAIIAVVDQVNAECERIKAIVREVANMKRKWPHKELPVGNEIDRWNYSSAAWLDACDEILRRIEQA